jgi:hypothetical protein
VSGGPGDTRTSSLERDPSATGGARARSEVWWDRFRYALLAGWLLVIVAVPVFGERTASWQDLRQLVASQKVDSVRISAELPANATGFATVQLHWRRGLLRYQTEVVQVRGSDERPEDAKVVLHSSPSSLLARLQPDVHLARGESHLGGGANLFGWQTPNALGIPAAVLFFAGLALLVSGPEPWRATRWAWFWLLFPPIGGIAFLLLSGPVAAVPRPRDLSRRLTGGWAFLLAIPLAAALAPYRW